MVCVANPVLPWFYMISGLWARWTFIGGQILMLLLIFRHTVRQNRAGAQTVIHYELYGCILMVLLARTGSPSIEKEHQLSEFFSGQWMDGILNTSVFARSG